MPRPAFRKELSANQRRGFLGSIQTHPHALTDGTVKRRELPPHNDLLTDVAKAALENPISPHGVFVIQSVSLPEFRFEYHPESKTVYLIRLTTDKPIGEAICPKGTVPDNNTAANIVRAWTIGYRTAKAELAIVAMPGESSCPTCKRPY